MAGAGIRALIHPKTVLSRSESTASASCLNNLVSKPGKKKPSHPVEQPYLPRMLCLMKKSAFANITPLIPAMPKMAHKISDISAPNHCPAMTESDLASSRNDPAPRVFFAEFSLSILREFTW